MITVVEIKFGEEDFFPHCHAAFLYVCAAPIRFFLFSLFCHDRVGYRGEGRITLQARLRFGTAYQFDVLRKAVVRWRCSSVQKETFACLIC